MAKSFGNTWWGKSWLNALSKIDYDNRLPRGRRYANNGSVEAIDIKKNQILAKVKGTRPTPYKVKITMPVFSAEEKKTLRTEIEAHAQVHASLLNKELSPDIEKIAGKYKIKLFPGQWSDFEMSCSCPDWAVPCKHIAAVIYMVGDAIDRNPWLLFQMKGMDLEKEFASAHPEMSIASIPSQSQFLAPKVAKPGAATAPVELKTLRDLDFSKIPYLKESIYKLLSPTPLFWKQDFREEMDERLSTMVSNHGAWQHTWQSEGGKDALPELRKGYALQLLFDEDLSATEVQLQGPRSKKRIAKPMRELFLGLAGIARDELEELHPSVEALWHLYEYCAALTTKGAIRPILVGVGGKSYRILWVPANSAEAVGHISKHISAALPDGLYTFLHPPKTKKEDAFHPGAHRNIELLCSVFLGMIVGEFAFDTPDYARAQKQLMGPQMLTRDPICDMFFCGMTVSFTGFGSDSIPQSIQKWISIFDLSAHKWRPILELRGMRGGSGFTLHISLEAHIEGEDQLYQLSEFLQEEYYAADRAEVLKSLNQLAGLVPQLHTVLKTLGKKSTKIDPKLLLEMLMDKLPLIELMGVQVLLPRELRELIHPKPSIALKASDDINEKFFSLDSLLSYSWQVSLGDEQIDPQEFFAMLNTTHGLVQIRNRYYIIQPDELEKLKRRIERGPNPTPQQLIQAALTGQFEGNKAGLSPEVVKIVKEITEIKELPAPKGIQATLRPYQLRGYAWMYKNARLGLGSVLADDMGLGKTLQVITLLEKFREEGKLKKMPALAIVPTSLVGNWQKECERFAPKLKTVIFHGSDRKWPKESFDLMVTTYGMLRNDLESLKKKKWGTLIIDEAQNIKNPETTQSKAVREIKVPIRIAMSGTPVENGLTDYWSIFDFALPGYLGTQESFRTQFAVPITRFRDPQQLAFFHGITAPFIMRRVKTDKSIIGDLPDKMVSNHWCNLEVKQATVYKNVVDEVMAQIEEAAQEGIFRQGLILKLLTALKQVCNHPTQYLGKGRHLSADSGKAAALIGILENIIAQHEKVLIFTQYKEMGELLVKMLATEINVEASFLHGGLNRKQRDTMVREFQEDHHRKVFILSLKAGGTGLNLTQANHVIHYDLWWNPAVENQATDRAFRIGQHKNVMVYRLLSKGTLEERIDAMLNSKKELANLTVSQGENWIGDLTNADLAKLVAFEG